MADKKFEWDYLAVLFCDLVRFSLKVLFVNKILRQTWRRAPRGEFINVKYATRTIRSSDIIGLHAHLRATFTPHETKLTWNGLKPSLRQLLRRLWRPLWQGPRPAAPLTLTLTLFLTITVARPHKSIVQFICCERVLTMRKVRCDRRRTLTDRRWRCLLLWTLSGERGFSQSRITEGPRDAPCMNFLSNTNLLMCTTLNEQQPLTFGDVYNIDQDLGA